MRPIAPGNGWLDADGATYGQSAGPGSEYWGGRTAGISTFRIDSPAPTTSCWSVGTAGTAPYYIPALDIH